MRVAAPRDVSVIRRTIERDGGAARAPRVMNFPHEQDYRLAALDHARHAEPGGERKRTQGRSTHIREIERYQSEVPCLEDEVRRLERCQAAGRVISFRNP